MLGDIYQRLDGSDKVPMEPKAVFMQVLNNLVFSQ
jgi:hypothetical protein